MAALAREGAPEGSWLRAEVQTGGKGRQGRAWQSPLGNLYASTLVRLRPADPPPASLALVAAVALQEVVEAFAGDAEILIKWPNDLLAIPPRHGEEDHAKHGGGVGAKLSGILLERLGDAVVIGFGVNLAAHPEGLPNPATSLVTITGSAPNPDSFLADLARAFAAWLACWRAEDQAPVRERWLEKAHPRGTPLVVSVAADQRIEGLFDGLDEGGALRLRLADGSLHVIQAGDVFLI